MGQALSAGGLFQDGGINANVTTPETVSFGVHHQLSPEWAVMGEAAWTRWSRFKGLTIKFDNAAQPNSVTDDDWEDTWFFALGATWDDRRGHCAAAAPSIKTPFLKADVRRAFRPTTAIGCRSVRATSPAPT